MTRHFAKRIMLAVQRRHAVCAWCPVHNRYASHDDECWLQPQSYDACYNITEYRVVTGHVVEEPGGCLTASWYMNVPDGELRSWL